MNEQQTAARTLREQQRCPAWCDGSDHAAIAVDFETEAAHFGRVSEIGPWFQVEVEQPVALGREHWPVVIVHGDNDVSGGAEHQHYMLRASSAHARSIAAALLRAADAIDFGTALAVTS